MRKLISSFTAIAVLALLFSCSPNPGASAGGELMKDFQPETFIADGLTAYLAGKTSAGLTFSDSFSESTAKAVSRAAGTGTLTVNAVYDEYPYKDFVVSGTFVYELPIESGVIQGYRVNSDKTDVPTITGKTDTAAEPTSFAVTMGSNALAPAYGTISTSGTTVTSKSGTAAEILPGTNAVFRVDGDNVSIDDVLYEPYTKDQMPGDYLEIMKTTTPLTLLINAKIRETGSTTLDLGNGNTFSTEIIDMNSQSSKTEIAISSPMHFDIMLNGKTFSVNTVGSLKATATSYGTQVTASMEFNDFASSMTVISGGSSETMQTKKISGTYSVTMAGLKADLTIGIHRYNSNDFQEVMVLNMLASYLSMWHWADISDDGTYENYLGMEPEQAIMYIQGKFDSTTNTLVGTLYSPYGDYPFVTRVSISGSGTSEMATIESLSFNGYDYSDSAIENFREVQALMASIIEDITG